MISMDFIRRNMKPLMAALTLMAMITFVFDDAMRAGSTWLIPLLFLLLFGAFGFVWGTRRGKQNEDLVVGAVLGLVFGLVLITFGQRGTEVEKKVAGLGSRELGNLKQQRESANRIVSQLFQKSHPIPKEVVERGEFSVRFYQFQMNQSLQRLMFGFGRGDSDQEAVFTHLLRQEARRLGITVSDDAVTDFIKMVTERKLSTSDFREVCTDLRVSDLVIYEIIRDELEARMAAEMTFPRTAVTPEQRWQDFRKVNVKHQIESVAIPVEPFVAGVTAPSESQLRKFFEEHKEKYPGSKGEPGFRQPLKARLAYLEADFETIEAELRKTKKPTDEEVTKYYEEHKGFYIEKEKKKEESNSDEDKQEPDSEKKEGEKKEGDSEKPGDKKPDGDKSDDKKPEAEKPGSEKSKTDGTDKKPEAKPEVKPEKSENSKKSEKPDSSGAAGDDKVTSDKLADGEKPADAKSVEEKTADKKEPESKTPETKSDEAKKTDDPKKSEENKTEDPLKLPATDESPEKRPEPKFRPLDEELKEEIREQLIADATLAEVQKRMSSAIGQMRKIGAQTIGDKKAKEYRSPAQVADEVRELGKKLELKYVETGLLTAQELFDLDLKGIGRATDPQSGGGRSENQRSVIDHIYMMGDDNTHTPEIAQDRDTSDQFAYWVVERMAAHVPEFNEPGVKDQVLKAWKIHEAAPKAEARAKALAKLATEQKSPLKDVLAGQTVLGDTESVALTAISPAEFSLFSLEGTAPQLNPLSMQQQRPQLTQIAGVDKTDFDVMKAIDRIAVGGTDVVPNGDRSGYLVIHVAARNDISAEADAPQRKDFMERWPHGQAAQDLASLTFSPLQQQWVETIERRYNVVWPVK